MNFQTASEFRFQSEKYFRRSGATCDRAAKLRWLSLAEAWHLLAEQTKPEDFEDLWSVEPKAYSMPFSVIHK